MKLFNFFKKKKKVTQAKEKLMTYFSEEYLSKLNNEHKLVCACIKRLNSNANRYRLETPIPTMDRALNNFLTRKLELEVQMDELMEFLRS